MENGSNQLYKLDKVAVRLVKEPPLYSTESFNDPEKISKNIAEYLSEFDREALCVINLDSALHPINLNICSIGTINKSIASPKEMLKVSILSNAAAVILAHNHPSGNPEPSIEDIDITKRMMFVYSLCDIRLLDHIIIGRGNYFSFAEEKCLPQNVENKLVDVVNMMDLDFNQRYNSESSFDIIESVIQDGPPLPKRSRRR